MLYDFSKEDWLELKKNPATRGIVADIGYLAHLVAQMPANQDFLEALPESPVYRRLCATALDLPKKFWPDISRPGRVRDWAIKIDAFRV